MRVLAIASQKGGSGKTTLAGHLAVAAERAGAGPVVLIDTDTNGTLTDWWDARSDDYVALAETNLARLGPDLEQLRRDGFRLAIIDTPPSNPIAVQSAIQHADLVVIPVRPSPHELRAAGTMVEICERAGRPIAFLLNGVSEVARLEEGIENALSAHGAVLADRVPQSSVLSESMIEGLTVIETQPDGAVAAAISGIWEELSDRAEKNFRRTVFSLPGGSALAGQTRPTANVFGRRVSG